MMAHLLLRVKIIMQSLWSACVRSHYFVKGRTRMERATWYRNDMLRRLVHLSKIGISVGIVRLINYQTAIAELGIRVQAVEMLSGSKFQQVRKYHINTNAFKNCSTFHRA